MFYNLKIINELGNSVFITAELGTLIGADTAMLEDCKFLVGINGLYSWLELRSRHSQ